MGTEVYQKDDGSTPRIVITNTFKNQHVLLENWKKVDVLENWPKFGHWDSGKIKIRTNRHKKTAEVTTFSSFKDAISRDQDVKNNFKSIDLGSNPWEAT